MVSVHFETVATLGLGFILGWVSRFGRRKNISEARFESKTGKQIK